MNTRPPERDSEPGMSGMDDIARRVREITAENDRLFRRLMDGERHFRRLAKAVWKVQEEERRRLALELHDGIGQTLTALKNHLQRQGARSADPEIQAAFEEALSLASAALQDTRELSRLLRPPVLDDLGLEAALNWLARIHRERSGLNVEVNWQLDDGVPDSQLETLIFRAVQEALTNVVKHAGSETALVSVMQAGNQLTIAVSDAGKGFDTLEAFESRDGSDGFGLRGIRDRVELFGGRLLVESAPGEGTRIAFTLPLPGNGEDDA